MQKFKKWANKNPNDSNNLFRKVDKIEEKIDDLKFLRLSILHKRCYRYFYCFIQLAYLNFRNRYCLHKNIHRKIDTF